MPIYEYYCPDNNTIYQFYAKTVAQGSRAPKCPDNPAFRLEKLISAFSITGASRDREEGADANPGASEPKPDARLEAAMNALESEFSSVDENDPKAMARMMRRMSEITGERIDGELEEVVRKLEEGVDPEQLEEQLGDPSGDAEPEGTGVSGPEAPESDQRPERGTRTRKVSRPPTRDPKLYDFEEA